MILCDLVLRRQHLHVIHYISSSDASNLSLTCIKQIDLPQILFYLVQMPSILFCVYCDYEIFCMFSCNIKIEILWDYYMSYLFGCKAVCYCSVLDVIREVLR